MVETIVGQGLFIWELCQLVCLSQICVSSLQFDSKLFLFLHSSVLHCMCTLCVVHFYIVRGRPTPCLTFPVGRILKFEAFVQFF